MMRRVMMTLRAMSRRAGPWGTSLREGPCKMAASGQKRESRAVFSLQPLFRRTDQKAVLRIVLERLEIPRLVVPGECLALRVLGVVARQQCDHLVLLVELGAGHRLQPRHVPGR